MDRHSNLRSEAARHLSDILAVVQQRDIGFAIDPQVRHSWLRCVRDYALDPLKPRKPQVLDSVELKRRRAMLGSSYPIVNAEMLKLCETLDLAVGTVFTDVDGVILQYVGTPAFAETARRSGFREGAVWSESEQGTNGMGTCLIVRQPVVIEQSEHFLTQNSGLTCFAAPIFDGCGGLVGALDISSLGVLSRPLMLALLKLTVQNIESRLLLHRARDCFVLRFHRRHQNVGTATEGIVIFNERGLITQVNRNALRLLNLATHDAVCGHSVEELFGFNLRQLSCQTRDTAVYSRPLIGRSGERLGFGLLQAPTVHARRHGTADVLDAGRALADAERDALLQVLGNCQWNVAQAARKLRIGRKTLYRKMHKHGLQR